MSISEHSVYEPNLSYNNHSWNTMNFCLMWRFLQYKSWLSQKVKKSNKKFKKSHKKSQKELAKIRLLMLSKTSRIVSAFSRHNTESQMFTIVIVTMWYLGYKTNSRLVFSSIFSSNQSTEKPYLTRDSNPEPLG
jgi:hypothetical protein